MRRLRHPSYGGLAVGKELEKREARYLALAARIAAEIGARVVKTYYTKEHFEKVVDGCPVPSLLLVDLKLKPKEKSSTSSMMACRKALSA